jgi:hypothetical protein
MKHFAIAAFGTVLVVATAGVATAGPKGMGGGHGWGPGPMATGSVRGAGPNYPGASYYAPGQVKKRAPYGSARTYAPGRNTSGLYNTPPGRQGWR